jgi:hypothetical protein
MPNNNKMKNSRTDIDNLFEQGLSDVSRAPRKTLSDEQIKAAAAASKSGAGVWLLSHAKEMLIGVVSFVTGCLVTFAVLYYTAPKPSDPQGNVGVTEAQVVGVDKDNDNDIDLDLDLDLDNDIDLNQHGQNEQTSQLQNPESQVPSPKFQVQSPKSQVQSPESQEEPVVVKKTIVQRDTVVINETVIVKDTVYVP